MTAGQKLRQAREHLGFTLRDVEAASHVISAARASDEFVLNLSRMSDIENKGLTPTIYRLFSLASIYRMGLPELLSWYGLDTTTGALSPLQPKKTRLGSAPMPTEISIPVKLEPGFDLRETANLGRMVRQWGIVPLVALKDLADADFSYGYIGTEDLTMFPVILPGALVQIDESKNKIEEGMWHSEYERPIYFLETREGFVCCWCSVKGSTITLQPHPLSTVQVRMAKFPQEADVVGQVVGIAMRLDWREPNHRVRRGGRELNQSVAH